MSPEHLMMSVLANAVGLAVVCSLRTAPPRLVLYACLVSMLAILVPWSTIAWESTSTTRGFVESVYAGVPDPATATRSTPLALHALWLGVGMLWLAFTLLRSARTRRSWRSQAIAGPPVEALVHPDFARAFRSARIKWLPDSRHACSTGVLASEIWLGRQLRTPDQLKLALNHELCHVRARDPTLLLLLVAIERMLWWNPLIWLLGRQARRQMEYACDERCKHALGVRTYRRTLAELMLQGQPQGATLEVPLGRGSNVIARMEKLDMTHTLKARHLCSLALGGALMTVANAAPVEGLATDQPTLIACHDLLPDGVQYDFRIVSDIDTREGRTGKLSVTLLDSSRPDSHEVPAEAGDFLSCVQGLVGVGPDSGWPDA